MDWNCIICALWGFLTCVYARDLIIGIKKKKVWEIIFNGFFVFFCIVAIIARSRGW